jgi:outer membrane lipoprotein carrier protein
MNLHNTDRQVHAAPFSLPRRVRPVVALACLSLCTVWPAWARGDEIPVEKYVHQLESSYKSVQSLRATFTQSYRWGSRTRTETGTVYFARGGRMRWQYREPQKKLFLSDGKHVELYVPEEKQLTRTTVKSSEDVRVPFRLLLSRLALHEAFQNITFADQALEARSGDRVLKAIPKHGDDSGIHEVFLEVTPDFDILRLVVVYTDRTRMQFTFENVERNVAVSGSLFQFTPPPGTEVINQH